MLEAAQRKLEGQEVTEGLTEERRGKVIDLMASLKALLEKRDVSVEEAEPTQPKAAASEGKPDKVQARAERKRVGGKK